MKKLLILASLLTSTSSFATVIVTVTAIPNLHVNSYAKASASADASATIALTHTVAGDHLSCSADSVSLQRPIITTATASGMLTGHARADVSATAQVSGNANCSANAGSAGSGFGTGAITGNRTSQNQAMIAFSGPISGQSQDTAETTIVAAKATDITEAGYTVDLTNCSLAKESTVLNASQAAAVLHFVAGKVNLP